MSGIVPLSGNFTHSDFAYMLNVKVYSVAYEESSFASTPAK